MKRYLLTLVLALASILPSFSMSYEEAREQAWFLTDKMAYELNLTPEQYNRAYEINLDYLMSIRTASDCTGLYWRYRDADFRCVLFDWQYSLFSTLDYFFRPIRWVRSAWYYPVFDHYRTGYFYFDCPAIYVSYRGGMWNHRSHNGHSPYYAIRMQPGRGMRDHYNNGDWRPRGQNNGGGFRPDMADGRRNDGQGRRDDNRPNRDNGVNNRHDGQSANNNGGNRRTDNGSASGNRGGNTFYPSWERNQGNGNGAQDGQQGSSEGREDTTLPKLNEVTVAKRSDTGNTVTQFNRRGATTGDRRTITEGNSRINTPVGNTINRGSTTINRGTSANTQTTRPATTTNRGSSTTNRRGGTTSTTRPSQSTGVRQQRSTVNRSQPASTAPARSTGSRSGRSFGR